MLGLEGCFVLSLATFYVLVAWLLEKGSSATTMNLSLLTSDFWAVLVGVGLLHSQPGPVYALAFGLTVGGLLLYHLAAPPPPTSAAPCCEPAAAPDEGASNSLAQPLVGSG